MYYDLEQYLYNILYYITTVLILVHKFFRNSNERLEKIT